MVNRDDPAAAGDGMAPGRCLPRFSDWPAPSGETAVRLLCASDLESDQGGLEVLFWAEPGAIPRFVVG